MRHLQKDIERRAPEKDQLLASSVSNELKNSFDSDNATRKEQTESNDSTVKQKGLAKILQPYIVWRKNNQIDFETSAELESTTTSEVQHHENVGLSMHAERTSTGEPCRLFSATDSDTNHLSKHQAFANSPQNIESSIPLHSVSNNHSSGGTTACPRAEQEEHHERTSSDLVTTYISEETLQTKIDGSFPEGNADAASETVSLAHTPSTSILEVDSSVAPLSGKSG